MNRRITASASARSLFPVAPPVDSLNVVGMIVSPRTSHAAGIDVVGYDVRVVGELFIADTAFASLGHNLLVQQLPHFRIRADLSIPSRVLGIVDATYSHLALALFSRNRLPAATGMRVVNWAQLISTESHGYLQFGYGAINADFRPSMSFGDEKQSEGKCFGLLD